jgi:hypothetical protein
MSPWSYTRPAPPAEGSLVLPNGDELLLDGYEVALVDEERARADGAVQADMNWSATDPAGHVHRFVTPFNPDTAATSEWLPTLVKEQRHIDCDGSCYSITHGDCDGYDVPVWFCRACRAEVTPGTVPDYEARNPGILIHSTWAWKFQTAQIWTTEPPAELPTGTVFRAIRHGDPGELQETTHAFTGPLLRAEVAFDSNGMAATYEVTETVDEPRRPRRL